MEYSQMNGFSSGSKLLILLLIFICYTPCYSIQQNSLFFVTGESPCDDDICMIMLKSLDAKNWTTVPLRFGSRDVVKSEKGYLAAGWCRPPLTTTDGVMWHEINLGGDCWNRVSWTNGRYFISGGIGDADDFASLYSTVYGNSFKLIYKEDGVPKISYVVFGNYRYIAVGNGENGSLLSYDGKHWQRLSGYDIGALTFDGREFIAINKQGSVGISTDGFVWKTKHVDASINYLIWVKNTHRYVAVGDNGKILTSQDAKTWIFQDSGTIERLNKVTWAFGLYVAVGEHGTILTSQNGTLWKKQDSYTNYNLIGVA